MNYKTIREFSPLKREYALSDLLCLLISPIFTIFFIKHKVIPNKITLLMILMSLIGVIFLMLPFWVTKILSILFFILWFVMDCSDGEVARYTKTFSKYGKELDYMAHLVCHPLFVISLFINYWQMGKYELFVYSPLLLVMIISELLVRNYTTFDAYFSDARDEIAKSKRKYNIVNYCLNQLLYFPNIVIFFPVVLILDWFNLVNSFYVLIGIVSINLLFIIKRTIFQVIVFYRG